MTIFDSIKYPIGAPPTNEELQDVPEVIYDEWIRITSVTNRYSLEQNFVILRKLIFEYEPDNNIT
jgi:hypothetical protein